MANEAVLKFEIDKPIPFTVADSLANGYKGTVYKLSGTSMTAAPQDGAVDQIAGIAHGDKIQNNGQTKVALYQRGIFLMYVSGSATQGDIAVSDAVPNMVKTGKTLTQFQISGTRVVGRFLEDATTGQQKLVYVDIRAENGA